MSYAELYMPYRVAGREDPGEVARPPGAWPPTFNGVDDVRNLIVHALIPFLPLLLWRLVPVARRRRRWTLWLATVGVDLDRRNIHAEVTR
ncbi:hypothetical protein [Streptomyces filamentosus]